MPIFRGLLLMLAIWLVFVLARHLYRSSQLQRRNKQTSTPAIYTKAVACTHCGVHTPKTEAIYQNGRYFCSKQHSNQHADQDNHGS